MSSTCTGKKYHPSAELPRLASSGCDERRVLAGLRLRNNVGFAEKSSTDEEHNKTPYPTY